MSGVDDQKTKAKGKSKASGSRVADVSATLLERISEASLLKLRQQALRRFKSFLAVANDYFSSEASKGFVLFRF
ncbi:hypothetical protein Q3G72_001656 [Acer saccharum]|nr:hypothetical protein Q3G72_034982 [Acer saccharum]KAK1558374.1 hypothetical protein Q3G72_001656 [Acer saccharum]